MDAMLHAAETADRVGISTGRTPRFGGRRVPSCGRALEWGRSPACAADAAYRACLALVLERIAAHESSIARCDDGHHAYMGGAAARNALG